MFIIEFPDRTAMPRFTAQGHPLHPASSSMEFWREQNPGGHEQIALSLNPPQRLHEKIPLFADLLDGLSSAFDNAVARGQLLLNIHCLARRLVC